MGEQKKTQEPDLNQLKKAGLVYENKEKNYIYYQLNTSVMEEIILWLSQFGESEREENNDEDK